MSSLPVIYWIFELKMKDLHFLLSLLRALHNKCNKIQIGKPIPEGKLDFFLLYLERHCHQNLRTISIISTVV